MHCHSIEDLGDTQCQVLAAKYCNCLCVSRCKLLLVLAATCCPAATCCKLLRVLLQKLLLAATCCDCLCVSCCKSCCKSYCNGMCICPGVSRWVVTAAQGSCAIVFVFKHTRAPAKSSQPVQIRGTAFLSASYTSSLTSAHQLCVLTDGSSLCKPAILSKPEAS